MALRSNIALCLWYTIPYCLLVLLGRSLFKLGSWGRCYTIVLNQRNFYCYPVSCILYSILFILYAQFSLHNLGCTIYCAQFSVHILVCIIQHSPFSVQYLVYTNPNFFHVCAQFSVNNLVCTVQCARFSVHNLVCMIQCARFSVHYLV